jgi:hypothetical protein
MAQACLGLWLLCKTLAADPSPADAEVLTDESPVAQAEATPVATPPVDTPAAWPVGGALGKRIYCIEGWESGHDGGAVNRLSGARGWLQWLAPTARQWGVVVGNRTSEWSAAARIANQGESFFRSQWPINAARC